LIDFKRVRHAARPSKDLRTSSLFGSSNGPTKHRTIGPRNDLTGILVCRRSAGFTDTFGCHRYLRVSPAIITRPSPPGLARSANCAWRTPVLQTVQRYRHRASSEAHRASPGRSRVPPGTHRNLRVPPNASGRSPALHPSRTGLSRPIARPAAARITSVVHRTTSVAHQVRRVRHERPRMLTGTSGFHPSPFGDSSKPVRPNSPFYGDSIVSLQRTTRSKAPGRTVQRLWRHGGHFRVDPRLSSLLSTLDFNGS
jgi:hypothetical protein